MIKRAIFLDLDGTLLNDNYYISKLNLESIEKAKSQGYKIYLTTGKSEINVLKYYDQLKLDTKLITSQGQVISLPGDSEFKKEIVPLTKEALQKVISDERLRLILENYLVETQQVIYAQNNIYLDIVKLINNPKLSLEIKESFAIEHPIIGLYLLVKKQSEQSLLDLVSYLNSLHQELDFAYWYTNYNFSVVTVKPKIVNKWTAISKIKTLDNLDYIITFGNGWSDILMLKNADLGIAMKNSNSKVIDAAKMVSEFDNNHDGVGIEILKLLD